MTYSRQALTVPGCEVKEIINSRGKYYTVLNARFLEPSPDYPNAMVSFRISNGADSTFVQLRIEEYDNLIRILQGLRENIENNLPIIREKEKIFITDKLKRDAELAQLRAIMGSDQENGVDAEKVMKMMSAMKAQQAVVETPPFQSTEDAQ